MSPDDTRATVASVGLDPIVVVPIGDAATRSD